MKFCFRRPCTSVAHHAISNLQLHMYHALCTNDLQTIYIPPQWRQPSKFHPSFVSLPDSQLLCFHVDRPIYLCYPHCCSNSNGGSTYQKKMARVLSSVHAISVHIFCRAHGLLTSVQHPYRPCVTRLLQLAWLTVPMLCYATCLYFYLCCVYACVCSVDSCRAMLNAVALSTMPCTCLPSTLLSCHTFTCIEKRTIHMPGLS